MSLFISLFWKIIPLYMNIVLGYLASKRLDVKREAIAPLLIYIIGPAVVFTASYKVQLNAGVLVLPWFIFFMSSVLALFFFYFSKPIFKDSTRNIFGFSAGTGNTGYFGIPLAIILLPKEAADIYIFGVLGSLFYESTVGFFITARGSYSIKESLLKVAKVPSIYFFILGIVLNVSDIKLGEEVLGFLEYFKGTYAILGMMMIGMGLMNFKELGVDFKFLFSTFFVKFVFWPLLMLTFIWLDQNHFQFFDTTIYKVMIIYSIVPLAANSVVLAVLLNTHPEKIAFAVFASTLFALFYIPFMASILL